MKKMTYVSLAIMSIFLVQGAFAGTAYAKMNPAEKLKIVQAKKAELNDHEWALQMKGTSGEGGVVEDTLVFKDMKVESKKMLADGYKPTNYTITIQEGAPTVWETMMSKEGAPVIFWRGEWEGQKMKGVLSKQMGEGVNEDYRFWSTSQKEIEKPVEVPAVVEEVPAAEKAAAAVEEVAQEAVEKADKEVMQEVKKEVPPAQEEKPKKKGWLF